MRLYQTLARVMAAALLAIPAAHAQHADGLSLAEAQALSTQDLAARLLGQSGSLVSESRVGGGFPPFSDANTLYEVEFASAPRSAGIPGLCEANYYAVDLEPDQGATRSRVRALRMGMRYRSVAEAPDACERSGRMLGAGAFQLWFRGNPDFTRSHAAFAVRAFANAHAFDGKIACTDKGVPALPDFCADPAKLLREITQDMILHFTISPCPDRPFTYCLSTEVPHSADGSHRYRKITIATQETSLDDRMAQVAVRAVHVEGVSFVN